MTELRPVNDTAAVKVPTLPDAQTVTEVRHWTDRLFSFRVTRPQSLRFRSGEFERRCLRARPLRMSCWMVGIDSP